MIFEKKIKTSVFLSVLVSVFVLSMIGEKVQANPLEGYTIHVTAPHMMDGEIIGPFHHFCKPINKVIIQCVLFESNEPNARMTEVEYMVSKDAVRSEIPKWSHLQNWHDHAEEIATGRVAIINPSDPKDQKGLADYVSKTDGIIFHLWPKGAPFPDGSVSIAQSVGHWQSMHGAGNTSVSQSTPSAPSSSQGPIRLTREVLKKMGIVETLGAPYGN